MPLNDNHHSIFSTLKWQDSAAFVCAVSYCILAWYSTQPEFLSLWEFYGLLGISFFTTFIVFFCSKSENLTAYRIIFWALCFRLIGIVGEPLWEDDFFRYLWDGYRFYESGSPYGMAPSEFFGDSNIPNQFQQLLARINYPNVPTIYGPVAEYSFLLSHLIAPAKVWSLQLMYAVVDMLLVVLLLKFSREGFTREGEARKELVSRRWVLLYAWSPLVIKEIAFTAHPDGLGVMLLVAALYCRYIKSFFWAAVLLALSVGAKIFALLLVPFLLWQVPFRYWFLFVGVLLALYGPFILNGASDMAGLLVFAQEWQFNSSVYGVMLQWLDPLIAKLILGFCFLVAYSVVFAKFARKAEWVLPRGDLIFGLFFLIAPVVNAWYLLWLLPFAVFYPNLWSWTFSIVVCLSYAIGINLNSTEYQPFELPLWVYFVEYGAVLAAILVEWWLRCSGRWQRSVFYR